MKIKIACLLPIVLFVVAGCQTNKQNGPRFIDLPGIKLKVSHIHENKTDKNEQATTWTINHEPDNSSTNNSVIWYRKDETNFTVIVPYSNNLTWTAIDGKLVTLPPSFPAGQFQAFESEQKGQHHRIITLLVRCSDETSSHVINYKLLVHPARPKFQMLESVPSPPQDDIVDATLSWDDAVIGSKK